VKENTSLLQYILHKNKRALFICLFLFPVVATVHIVSGEKIPSNSPNCADILFLFARGSSQNQLDLSLDDTYSDAFAREEKEAGVFFQTVKAHLDREYPHVTYKAQSVHNFPDIGNSNGYKAVPAFSPPYANILDAEFSWFPAGDYRQSVQDGADEVAAYVTQQAITCPDQKIVLGGYSQGAHVIGDSLFRIGVVDREHIAGVALFGDPKFTGSDFSILAPFNKATTYPWKRGTATSRDRGMLDARIPYVPDDMSRKVFSWCFKDDFICSGTSGLRLGQQFVDKLGQGHTRYAGFGVQQAATEIIQNIAPELYAIDKGRGGVDKEAGPVQPVPYTPNDKPIDFMFLVDYSAGNDDVLGQLRFSTPFVLPVFNSYFSDIKYAVGDFGETGANSNVPRINLRQDFKPLQATATPTDQILKTFISKLAFGTLSGGGGDAADPHILAIERMLMEPSWRQDAKRHLVIISDRPLKETYTYNMCNSDVRSGFGLDFNYCMSQPALESGLTKTHPEYCQTAIQVLADTDCSLGNTRTLQDAIKMANSKNIDVSIVVPHAFPVGVNNDAAKQQLEYLAGSTGGLFLKYDVFSQASYSDMMWQILNHSAPLMRLSSYDPVDTINQWGEAKPEAKGLIRAHQGVSTVLDVSQSPVLFESYNWDFDSDGVPDDQTGAPSVEHSFELADSGKFITVVGQDPDGRSATLSLPVLVEIYDGPDYQEFTIPEDPSGVKALLKDGNLEVSWGNRGVDETVFVSEATTGAPIVSIPAEAGDVSIAYDEDLGGQVQVWLMNESASSARQLITIEDPQMPAEEETPPIIGTEVPKDKRGLGESNPWGQLLDIPEKVIQLALSVVEPRLASVAESAVDTQAITPQVAGASDDAQQGETPDNNETITEQVKPQNRRDLFLFIFGFIGLIVLLVLGVMIIL
jgi:hypothetical protein